MTDPATTADPRRRPVPPPAAAVAIGAGVVVCWWFAGRTGPPPAEPLRTESLWALAVAYAPASAWLLAAFGVGRLASGLLPRDASPLEGRLHRLALGVGLLMAIDALLGRLGLLSAGGGTLAWGLTAILAIAAAWPRRPTSEANSSGVSASPPADALRLPWWAGLPFAPALGTLLLASIAAPGWLWSSEFGGYDSLSYHLLLPREWFEAGRMAPLAHNAYSGLPSHVEASTLHLMAMLRDPLAAGLPAQALQACLAAIAAATIAVAARRRFGPAASILAAGIFIGTPWTVVTGSLAYNEATVAVMLAAGLSITLPRPAEEAEGDRSAPGEIGRRAATVGILAAAAVGAKATSMALVALPLGLLLLAATPRGRRLAATGIAIAVAIPLLLPWLVHNAIVFGQPFFPLLAGILGGGDWTETQIAIFEAAHGPPSGGLRAAATAFLDELLRHGLGPNPMPGEPWRPWWGVLWPLGMVAAIAAIAAGGDRRGHGIRLAAAILAMLAFWFGFTHRESRFLAPAAVPLALLAAAAWPRARPDEPRSAGLGGAATIVAAWGLLPAALLLGERPLGDGAARVGAPAAATGQVETVSGRLHRRLLRDPSLDREARAALLSTAPVWTFVNDPSLTGRGGRALLVGESRAFYLDRPGAYASVWNRGRLSELVRAHPREPGTWRRALREEGFTLVMLDEGMIDRWRGDGWWDPALDAATLEAFREVLVPLGRFPSGVELFEIPETDR